MTMYKQSWFPHPRNITVVPRGVVPYRHSLWVGLTAPILNLPSMVFEVIIAPVVAGFISIIMITGVSVVAGISGCALGYDDKPIETEVDDTPKAD